MYKFIILLSLFFVSCSKPKYKINQCFFDGIGVTQIQKIESGHYFTETTTLFTKTKKKFKIKAFEKTIEKLGIIEEDCSNYSD